MFPGRHTIIISKNVIKGHAMTFENINIRKIVPTALSKNAIIIDVRKPEDFYKKHIPMSVNLPLEKIRAGLVSFPQNKTLIVYCESGGSSMHAAKLLSEMGYNVINCIGGIKNYNGSVTKGT